MRVSDRSRVVVVRGGVELPTFRLSGMGETTGQSVRDVSARTVRAAPVPDHHGLGKPGSVAVRSKIGQRRGYCSVAADYGVQYR